MSAYKCGFCGRKYVGDLVAEWAMKGKERPVGPKECKSQVYLPEWGDFRCDVCIADPHASWKVSLNQFFSNVKWDDDRDIARARDRYTHVLDIELGDVWQELVPGWTPLEDEVDIRIRAKHAGHSWSPPKFGQLELAI